MTVKNSYLLPFIVFCVCAIQPAGARPMLWQQEGTVLSDLGSARSGEWRAIDYESERFNGTMLYAPKGVKPEAVTVDPALKGWHRVYVATFATGHDRTARLQLRLQGDGSPSLFRSGEIWDAWTPGEKGEEVFWKCADLTGKRVTVGKASAEGEIGLMWLRFEPMTADEIAAAKAEFADPSNRRLHAHCDMEWMHYRYDDRLTPDERCGVIDAFAQSDVGIASLEIWDHTLEANRDFYRECVRRAERYGVRVYAAYRMSECRLVLPWLFELPYANEHPEFHCRDRDGEAVTSVSYAFPEVGAHEVERVTGLLDLGFHGVSPILHRGVQLLWEKPLVDRFRAKHPDLDPRTLSLDDPRLAEIRCALVTENFMRPLRRRLDAFAAERGCGRLHVNPIVPCTIADCRRQGLDVEGWVREGLVDSVVFGMMRIWEDEDRFRDESKPGFLSVEKYSACKRSGENPVRRAHGNKLLETFAEEAARNVRLSRETGVRFYYDLHWEGTILPEKIAARAARLYGAGAEGLSLWDCFELRVSNRDEWFVTSRLGHKGELESMPKENEGYRKLFRILKIDGISISSYHPNWIG